ncbi:MAG: RNA pseudouridine synthase [Treponema sp.]|jgi:23S rRNA pseudouridine1911/1915/1917 synthase|nr:RNA pseudouridine synthase [Treponema sp.]
MPDDQPLILAETSSYAVVYKPPFMHTVPLRDGLQSHPAGDDFAGDNPHQQTLLDWCFAHVPHVKAVRGRRTWERGVLHRLDYETRGLVLIVKTQDAFDALMRQQEQGLFVKTYRAESAGGTGSGGAGFPSCPYNGIHPPCIIESAFRAFGPGRAAVRPALKPFPKNKDIALDRGVYYRTEILEKLEETGGAIVFRVRLERGFRHQIRCHLAWLGHPLVNDALYGGIISCCDHLQHAPIGLRAVGLTFIDPAGSGEVSYTLGVAQKEEDIFR